MDDERAIQLFEMTLEHQIRLTNTIDQLHKYCQLLNQKIDVLKIAVVALETERLKTRESH